MKYISNVLVLSDAKHPENEGKVFLFSYGAKIFAKLMNAINPEFEDEKSFVPFDFWAGAPFKIKIRNVEGYKNYDKSEFGECAPLFEDDSAMEAVWKSQYPLQEFINAKNFKPYEELKTKFYSVINAVPVPDSKENGGDDDDDIPVKATPVRSSKPSAVSKNANDDDDFELFRTMIED